MTKMNNKKAKIIQALTSLAQELLADVSDITDEQFVKALQEQGVTPAMGKFDRLNAIKAAFPDISTVDAMKLSRRLTDMLGEKSLWQKAQETQKGGLPGGVAPQGQLGGKRRRKPRKKS